MLGWKEMDGVVSPSIKYSTHIRSYGIKLDQLLWKLQTRTDVVVVKFVTDFVLGSRGPEMMHDAMALCRRQRFAHNCGRFMTDGNPGQSGAKSGTKGFRAGKKDKKTCHDDHETRLLTLSPHAPRGL